MSEDTNKPRPPLVAEVPFDPSVRGQYVILSQRTMRVVKATYNSMEMRETYSPFFEKILSAIEDFKWAIQDWWGGLSR